MGARYSALRVEATPAITLAGLLAACLCAAPARGQPVPLEIKPPLGSPTVAADDPGGFGRFVWGMSVAAAREIEPALAPYAGAEGLTTEAEALERIHDHEARVARAGGRQAWKAFRQRPVARPRLSAWRFWLDLDGLPGRVELRFVDDRLYAGVIRVLYGEKQKPAAARILDGLVAKYGPPLDPPEGMAPVAERPRLDFAIPGGRLQVLRRRITPGDRRGMLRLHYTHSNLAEGVERYLQGLRGRLSTLSGPGETPPKAVEDAPRPDPLLQHL